MGVWPFCHVDTRSAHSHAHAPQPVRRQGGALAKFLRPRLPRTATRRKAVGACLSLLSIYCQLAIGVGSRKVFWFSLEREGGVTSLLSRAPCGPQNLPLVGGRRGNLPRKDFQLCISGWSLGLAGSLCCTAGSLHLVLLPASPVGSCNCTKFLC